MESVGLLLLLLATASSSLLLTLQPLWRRPEPGASALLGARDGALAERREALVAAIQELDRDYRVGNLVESDYRALRAELASSAVLAMQALEQREAALEVLAEAEVARRRRAANAAPGSSTSAAAPATRGVAERVSCPGCGLPAGADDHFCRRCGTALAATPPPARAVRAPVQPPGPAPSARPGRQASGGPRVWLAAGGGLVALLVAGVVWLYQAAPQRAAQAPVGTLGAGANPRALALDPTRPELVVAGGESGLLASADGGATWQPASLPPGWGAVSGLVWAPGSPPLLYAGGPAGLARSADGGRTWEILAGLPPGAVRALGVDPARASSVYVQVAGAGLVATTDGGRAWTRLPGAPPEGADVTALAVVPSPMGGAPLLFAATARQGILQSVSNGADWADASGFVNGALPTRRVTSLAYDPNSGDSSVDPMGMLFRGALYAGTDLGLFRSVNAGSSWDRLPLGADAPVAAVVPSPLDARRLLVVDQQGRVFRSDDRGLTWPGARGSGASR